MKAIKNKELIIFTSVPILFLITCLFLASVEVIR